MKRIILVHGWGGSPKSDWFPWLSRELDKFGYEVIVPAMPETNAPEIETWVNNLARVMGTPDIDTYFVGHSIGCQTIMRYLETINTSVGGAIFVAGWFNLENMESEEEEKIADPWLKTVVDLEKVKKVLPQSTLIISDNDPYGAFEENKEKFSPLITKQVVLLGRGHFNKGVEPEILEECKLMLK